MTLPVTLADTPALPRVTEAAVSGPAAGEGGEARFAETLAGAMGAAPVPATGKTGEAAAPVETQESPTLDPEAMLADLEQRAVTVEGEALAAGPGMPGDPLAIPAVPSVGQHAGVVPPEGGEALLTEIGAEAPGDEPTGDEVAGETPPEEEIPLDLPLTALLAAAALPVSATGEGAAPPVQAADAAVEAARRAMAATMAVPGLAKAEKGGKGPLDGPESTETAPEGEVAMAKDDEIGPAKAAQAAELRTPASGVPTVTTELRIAAEARREAVAEITLAALGGEAAEAAGTTATPTGTASVQVGTQALSQGLGGPIQTARPGWEGVLADRIAAELSGDGKEIELDLAPETLGQLKIKLEVVDGLAQVRIVTETTEAARLFQQAEHRLSESLSRAGLSLGGQDTMSRDAESGQTQGQGLAGQGGNGPGDRGGRPRGIEMHFDRQGAVALAEQAGRAGRGLVNLIA
ncbi:MAG: flagellar hook-length control protein FliK [Rhodobacteraceae bacterium]|nr:flagellar hook-length control protein FliK [Paracoccaceae bacterium]